MRLIRSIFVLQLLVIQALGSKVLAGEILDASYDPETRRINVALSAGCNVYEYAVEYPRNCVKGKPTLVEVGILSEIIEKKDCARDFSNVVQIDVAKISCKPPLVVTIRESEGSTITVDVVDTRH